MFSLESGYTLTPAQASATSEIVSRFRRGQRRQVLLGVTGSGKTFAVADIIRRLSVPVLVLSPNKALAAQLYQEFRGFFPSSRVGYYISYYDYYQPEAYIPQKGSYIAKEVSINTEIERMRTVALSHLLQSPATIIVASVSAIYSVGCPGHFRDQTELLTVGQEVSPREVMKRLVGLGYRRTEDLILRGLFRFRGNCVEVFPVEKDHPLRFQFTGNHVGSTSTFDSITGSPLEPLQDCRILPLSSMYLKEETIRHILPRIEEELSQRVAYFQKAGEPERAQRIRHRTRNDMNMLQELGYCPGIENYAMYLSGRNFGETPCTLFSHFPSSFLTVIDESHITIPQIQAMFRGDRSRKKKLVEYGFRLPSALENRPLTFREFNKKVDRVLYVSATPGPHEYRDASNTTELLVRPTGLLDPVIDIRRCDNPVSNMLPDINREISRKNRVLITTLTKKMSEKLSDFLVEKGYRVTYMHSDIKALERLKIIRDLQTGRRDILVGINLLREGLDLPEVSLVIILDADAEGYLRSQTALIQTLGRASRHLHGRAILYIHRMTPALEKTMEESSRRRRSQEHYNRRHQITPTQITRKSGPHYHDFHPPESETLEMMDRFSSRADLEDHIERMTARMKKTAARLDFQEAIRLKEEIHRAKNHLINEYWEE